MMKVRILLDARAELFIQNEEYMLISARALA